jgi:hypothetical protein
MISTGKELEESCIKCLVAKFPKRREAQMSHLADFLAGYL